MGAFSSIVFLSFSLLKLSLLVSLSFCRVFVPYSSSEPKFSLLSLAHTKKKKKSVFSIISAVVFSHIKGETKNNEEREKKKEYDFKHVKKHTLSASPLLVFRV